MIVDPGPLVYRGSLTATHTAQAVGSFRRKCAAEGCTGAAWQRRVRMGDSPMVAVILSNDSIG